jgi:hypothetical protein
MQSIFCKATSFHKHVATYLGSKERESDFSNESEALKAKYKVTLDYKYGRLNTRKSFSYFRPTRHQW